MKQQSLTDGFEKFRKKTRKEKFLDDMEVIIPWQGLVETIEPFYPKPEGAGRRPIGIERMLRIYFLQHWFNLSDPAAEEALYDSLAMRQFVGIDLGQEAAPDETTICKFRHLMERHNLGDQLFHLVNQYLQENGLKVNRGTIVDASIINAPSSTKNKKKQRDPEMHQTKKGNQWYFGMKAHIGVDSRTKLIHHVAVTAANVHDSVVIGDLLHGDETRVWGDSAYTGKGDVITEHAPHAKDFTQMKGFRHRKLSDDERSKNRNKSRIRARVEHVFGVMKGQFGFTKVRYKGLAKNAHHLYVSCALVNLVMAKKSLMRRRTLVLQA
ncbi:IS5 family transposase [Sedimenticola selenatireducens]|uniref:IS5 family transposase n=1 Tax=Sedimenticola selenatireducens TaxID=191960 RepID=UPI000490EC8C|nr:IS5 family transposase [Sedimenticola selenatireducens]